MLSLQERAEKLLHATGRTYWCARYKSANAMRRSELNDKKTFAELHNIYVLRYSVSSSVAPTKGRYRQLGMVQLSYDKCAR